MTHREWSSEAETCSMAQVEETCWIDPPGRASLSPKAYRVDPPPRLDMFGDPVRPAPPPSPPATMPDSMRAFGLFVGSLLGLGLCVWLRIGVLVPLLVVWVTTLNLGVSVRPTVRV